MNTIKHTIAAALATVAFAAALLLLAMYKVHHWNGALAEARSARFESASLADELRQSSDDLTRLARTYVVTGDPMWEEQFFEVLAIRNGERPRPEGYEKIYWDFRAIGLEPPNDGGSTTVPLLDMMRAAGFADAEFAKLEEAAANSDALVETETVAMNLVKGIRADGSGAFTLRGEPDLEIARRLMHGADYHRFKADIMRPFHEFQMLLDERTETAIEEVSSAREFWLHALAAALVLMLLSSIGSLLLVHRWVSTRLGTEPHVLVRTMRRLSEGDLSAAADTGHRNPDSVLSALTAMATSFADSVSKVRASAESVAATSSRIAEAGREMNERTERQATALEDTGSSVERVSTTVQRNADSAARADALVLAAYDVAVRGGEVVGQVTDTMKSISDSSTEIASIIDVIDDIAFQTNLLALNAAVEAARAGEQGRGFAVVASEVRELAQRSSRAADDIKGLINDSVSRVQNGAEMADRAGGTMDDIAESVKSVTDIMSDISKAGVEQSRGIAQISAAVGEIDRATRRSVVLVNGSADDAAALDGEAHRLLDAVAVFTLAEGERGAGATRRAA